MAIKKPNRVGIRNGKLRIKEIEVFGDLRIGGDIVFGSVSFGKVSSTGGIDLSTTTADYGIDMNGATISTMDIRLSNGATFDNTSADVLVITEDTITIAGSTAINLDGPSTVTGKLYLDSTTAGDNFAIAAFGDATGLELDDSNLNAVEIYPELPTTGAALTGGNVAYGIRNRFLVNKAQTNNVSIYGTQGQIRIKADLAAGVHAGLYGYLEQSGSVTLSSSGAFNAACNLGVETDASLVLDAGVNLCGNIISSLVNTGGTLNGNIYATLIRKSAGMQDWDDGIVFTDCVESGLIKVTDTAAPVYFIDLDGASGANGTITSDSGTAATDWKARIKVKTDDGTDAWINVYSTSHEA